MKGNAMTEDMWNRVRIVQISPGAILAIFNRDHQVISLPVIKGIPEGARVVSVQHSFSRDVFEFLIQHESFSPVEPGAMIPRLNGDSLEEVDHIAIRMDDVRRYIDSIKDNAMAESLCKVVETVNGSDKPPKKSWEFLGAP
jgi:hypothetical protein